MQKFRIICLKVAFLRRHIWIPVGHLVFLQKYLKTLTFFAKTPSSMYDWVPNTPLEDFVPNAPQKELANAPVKKYLTAIAWRNYH